MGKRIILSDYISYLKTLLMIITSSDCSNFRPRQPSSICVCTNKLLSFENYAFLACPKSLVSGFLRSVDLFAATSSLRP